uniref:Peptidase C14 caspase domain-containing protein n=1 Tax=Lactuca sativa TaxID=4236 RepID=A0A9R1W0T3_LACSA|nr:hypothetical protein LSAT_V11C400177620 [Lactuca sativa]
MGKKAMLIGCNYFRTKTEINRCINGVKKMYCCLVYHYGFSEDDIKFLINRDESYTHPTGRNIRQALDELVQSAEPGDFLIIHYSEHDTHLPSETGNDDDTEYEEHIVPINFNLINSIYLL